ncbi:non-ribosomal peptide synthetase [Catenulispora pinisilvae]|uniref:non-ribosomal peptide synthetase n=1 Tax=Catenulispora pinisilvae TaxID=2705253 RepID=UPI0018911F67|nr:non-ribosomal peptide synthetase [Catenulispora pinisilvae]
MTADTREAPQRRDLQLQLRQEWDDAATLLPQTSVPEVFARRVAEEPGAIAVESEDEEISYARLDARSDRLARRLVEQGVAPGDHVAVLMRRSSDLVAALLAVAKAGAAFVPLSTRDPAARMHAVIAGSGCRLLLVDETTQDHEMTRHLAYLRADVAIGADAPAPGAPFETDPFGDRTTGPEALLYIMHTSGSTGAPKGVAVTHRNVVSFALDRIWRSGDHDRILFHSPHAFDASTYEIWVPLLTGGTVVVASGQADAALLRRLGGAGRITSVWLGAGLFGALAEADPECLAGIRQVWTGGDVVPPAAVARVQSACPGLTVYDGYGPTETTTFATRHRIARIHPEDRPVPIGGPMDNTRVYLLDDRLRLAKPGESGQVYVAGDGVARGYVSQPGLTARRFLPDIFGVPGERMYATGDVARRAPDGSLSLLGRADDQVKIHGFRIEPGEIESVLAAHPEVSRAVLLVSKTPDGSGQLAAVVVPAAPGGRPDPEALRGYLAERLPAHMVPARIVVRAGLPLTAHDKVDHRILISELAAADAGPAAPVAHTAPESAATAQTMARVAELWSAVLGVDRIAVDDSFFDRGGNSLKLIGLHARLCRTFGVDIPVQRLFEISSIRAMALYLQKAAGPGDGPVPVGDPRAASEAGARGAARRDRIRARREHR